MRRTRLIQRHSQNLLLVHIVWTTHRRDPLLAAAADGWLARLLDQKAGEIGSKLVASGNATDHVHVLVRYPSTLDVATIVQRLKGASSYTWNVERAQYGRLTWQSGSWAESVSPSQLAVVARYVARQREHHRDHPGPEDWESAPASLTL
jgi:REP element-mobilizing transposase RayT